MAYGGYIWEHSSLAQVISLDITSATKGNALPSIPYKFSETYFTNREIYVQKEGSNIQNRETLLLTF